MKKEKVIHVRCTDEQKKTIESRADKAGLTVSEYALRCSINSRTRIRSSSKDAARTITQCQVYVNEACLEVKNCQDGNSTSGILSKLNEIQEGLDEIWRLLK